MEKQAIVTGKSHIPDDEVNDVKKTDHPLQ